ncbi:cyclase family protein [Algoriphagus sp. CAU 1675]|uniref:cyclase family protein n=1 Tax=Algoriphagus sp. CAU 1675 TaxID=3032597 RepID=UPI0023DA3CE6|nr:cyclase family protein [Algoriphagus sp. CAU 1675]MDF2156347.1 cyclase family protein [Algoriphagus sp. CAU 1675]
MIEPEEMEQVCQQAKVEIHQGDTVLIRTDHFSRHFGTENWGNGPGISTAAARWLRAKKIAAFGVETMSPGIPKISNKEVHLICGEMGFTHYENLINLDPLTGIGRFRFIALPLKIRGGTGSPVRAILN